jgi:hypothetical protein
MAPHTLLNVFAQQALGVDQEHKHMVGVYILEKTLT